jgi:hypothetical protein
MILHIKARDVHVCHIGHIKTGVSILVISGHIRSYLVISVHFYAYLLILHIKIGVSILIKLVILIILVISGHIWSYLFIFFAYLLYSAYCMGYVSYYVLVIRILAFMRCGRAFIATR